MDEPNTPAVEKPIGTAPEVTEDSLIDEVLVEEVSIDGMCGVY